MILYHSPAAGAYFLMALSVDFFSGAGGAKTNLAHLKTGVAATKTQPAQTGECLYKQAIAEK